MYNKNRHANNDNKTENNKCTNVSHTTSPDFQSGKDKIKMI